MATAKFIYDTAERCPDLYYACKFSAPDPFIFIETRGKKYLVMSDLEIDRTKKQAKGCKVLSLSKFTAKAAKKSKTPSLLDTLNEIFKSLKVKKLEMPPASPFSLVDGLRKRGYKIQSGSTPFYPKRLQKTADEKKALIRAQKAVFDMMALAEKTLRACKIRNNKLYYKGKVLTCEALREMIHFELMRRNFIAPESTIVACGADTIDPHNFGKGPLRPHQAIIVDIFPKSIDSLFWGDATRTFCVGKAPERLKKLYNAVKAGQEYALKNIKAGVNGRKIHETILKMFKERGFNTGEIGGRMQGFFHSTGHGIGLELHESPIRVGPVDQTLKAGMCTSVEPGLYYKGLGGVRIEDIVIVTKTGCQVLAGYPKRLEV